MIPVEFEYYAPQTLDEVFALLEKYGVEAKVLAGGVDIIRNMKYRVSDHLKYIISLKNIGNLDFIDERKDGLRIGSMTRLSSLAASKTVKERYEVLYRAVKEIATPPLRSSGTVGGNLCQDIKCWNYNLRGITSFMRRAMGAPCWRKDKAFGCKARGEDDIYHSIVDIGQDCWASSPSDLAVVLSSVNGRLKVTRKGSERQVSVEDFYSVNGDCLLELDEIITEVFIPRISENSATTYIKDRRGTMDFAVANIAALLTLDSDKQTYRYAKIVLGGVAPKPISAQRTFNGAKTDKVVGVISEELLKNIRVIGPLTDYKANEAKVLIKDAVELAKLQGGSNG